MHGEPVQVEGTEMLARCIQHRDRSPGRGAFLDRLDAETRKRAMSEIRSAPWFAQADAASQPVVKTSHIRCSE